MHSKDDEAEHTTSECGSVIKPKKWTLSGIVNAAFRQGEEKRKLHSNIDPETCSTTSAVSYYMERDFRYYFQHPYFRLTVAYLVTFCNFLIYAEDPVAHSEKECFIPVVGNCVSFVFTKYPPNVWGLLKVFMWLLAILCGIIIGKLLIHKLIFSKFILKFPHNFLLFLSVS